MQKIYAVLLCIGNLQLVSQASAHAAACSTAKLAAVRAPATAAASSAYVDCDLTLAAGDVITKRLILQGPAASGTTLDCSGALLDGAEGTINYRRDMIEIRSRRLEPSPGDFVWERPQDVVIRNCRITGSVRIWGLAKNGEGEHLRASSRRSGHVTRARDNAPRRVTLENLEIFAVGRTPLYIAPGVTHVTLQGSEIAGEATSVGVYLDTESGWNILRGNYLHVTSRREYVGGIYTRKREEIAIDNSTHNKIYDNRLSTLEGGGIYLYRNCGEGGTVRHGIPSHNQIINNIFYYNRYSGDNPAVYLGSRSNTIWEGRFYCEEDAGFVWGSSADNRSFARYNVVMQNQIYRRSLNDMIVWGDSSNRPNYVDHNQGGLDPDEITTRLAGCYVATGYKNFIPHGQTIDVFKGDNGEPTCGSFGLLCEDALLSPVSSADCEVQRQLFDCRVTGNNDGCRHTASCPPGTRIVGGVAACNLEWGTVSDTDLAQTPVGQVKVLRTSKKVSDGRCWVHDTGVSSGNRMIADIADRVGVSVGCREHDKNGGDCHIRGALYCR